MKHRFIIFILTIGIGSGCETAFENDLQGHKVHLLAPANGMVTIDTVHTFYWDTLQDATHYQLQVVSPRFDSIARLIVDTNTTTNQFKLRLARNSVYQWRVRASNSSSYSDYSDTFQITIQ